MSALAPPPPLPPMSPPPVVVVPGEHSPSLDIGVRVASRSTALPARSDMRIAPAAVRGATK